MKVSAMQKLRMQLRRDRMIVDMRLKGKSLQHIAGKLGISRERVRQVFTLALEDEELAAQWTKLQEEKRLEVQHQRATVKLQEELTKAKKAENSKRKCRGCKKRYNAREMRSHKCRIAWYRRTGKPWQYVTKRKSKR